MDAFLTETALKRLLRSKKDYPPILEQIVGKYLIIEIINIIEIVPQKSYSLCYCHKFSGCAPHFYSDNYYMCEVCQLCTNFCPYVLECKLAKDARYVIKIAADIFKRRQVIIQNINERHRAFFDIAYQYTFFMSCAIGETATLTDLIDPYRLFNNQ